jgi:DUF971 family protein
MKEPMNPGVPNDPPTEIVVHQQSRRLEVTFGDDERYVLPFEFLRVHSPSAAVQGHGPGQETLQTGKRDVTIVSIEPVGHYAIKPTFSDGHESGIFTWAYLRRLGREQASLWNAYLAKLAAAGESRDPLEPFAAAHVGEARRQRGSST